MSSVCLQPTQLRLYEETFNLQLLKYSPVQHIGGREGQIGKFHK